MAKPFLRSGSLDDVLTLGENGQPIYTVALQLREALRIQQQQAAADCLAIPILSEQGNRIDWYAPISGRVIAWNAADEAERANALRQLEHFQATISAISLHARNSGKTSQQLFAALLTKAMQFPDQQAVYLVAGNPVVTFWGFVKPDGKTHTDPLACLRSQESPIALTDAPPPVPVINTPLTTPVLTPPAVGKKLRRIWWLLPAVVILPMLALLLKHSLSDNESSPPVDAITAPIKPLAKPPIPRAGVHLPLSHAEVLPPPVVTPVAVENNHALTLPAQAVRIGSTAFLNGKWRVTLAIKDPLTGKPPTLLYQFKDGKGTVKISRGDKVSCQVAASAGLMQSGNLIINSRTKARCSDGSRYQMPELVCKQGETDAADCSGRYGSETLFPITIKRESK